MAKPEEKAVATANTMFSADMLTVMSTEYAEKPENYLCSPFSLSAAVAMIKIGARGTSSKELQTAFHFPEDSIIEKGYHSILSDLQEENEEFTLLATNRMFMDNKFEIQEPYAKSMTDNFLAGFEYLDFEQNKDVAAKRINAWVEETTEKKIKNIITPDMLNPFTRLVLVNTIYFKGEWRKKFDRENTRKEAFFLDDSKTVQVEMMSMSKSIEYGELPDMDAKVIALSYATHNDSNSNAEDDFVMIIIAPNAKTGVKKIEGNLKKFTPDRILGDLKSTKVDVRLPRFNCTCTIDCIRLMRKLGVSDVFDKDKADLSGIRADRDLCIDFIVQKTFIEVDEKGTEAAAATVGLKATSALKSNTTRTRFDADRPFVFQLVDRKHNIILFSGRYSNPEKQS